MAITYRFLTDAQQKELASQKAFQYEYEHFIAKIEADADPLDATKADAVTKLEAQVTIAQTEYDALTAPKVG